MVVSPFSTRGKCEPGEHRFGMVGSNEVCLKCDVLKAAVVAREDEPDEPPRVAWLGGPEFLTLKFACHFIDAGFGSGCTYLVGSALESRDFRDVDIRTILDDEHFERLFPGAAHGSHLSSFWALFCTAMSGYLTHATGLPIDYQVQQRTAANEKFKGKRVPMGIFHSPVAK